MKHVLLRNSRLKGWEFGVLRALEEAIVQQTGAEVVEVQAYGMHPVVKRAGHGMRFEGVRSLIPKKKLQIEADVLWYILMCPENYELDFYTGWEQVPKRIVYIFDTLVPHFSIVKKLFSGNAFNILITSFHDATVHLEQLTGNQWHAVEQAVPPQTFHLIEKSEKSIHFSSYGRRHTRFHHFLIDFCLHHNLYYDYSTHNGPNLWTHENELYRQYAWHIQHSIFTVSWPVEVTNPQRAGYFNPITCRWFEAAACGTVIVGQTPDNTLFDHLLHPNLVVPINPDGKKETIFEGLESLWRNKDQYQQTAYVISRKIGERLTWKNRVLRILQLI